MSAAESRKVAASRAKAALAPGPATRNAPTAGPAATERLKEAPVNALAEVRYSRETSLGIAPLPAGKNSAESTE